MLLVTEKIFKLLLDDNFTTMLLGKLQKKLKISFRLVGFQLTEYFSENKELGSVLIFWIDFKQTDKIKHIFPPSWLDEIV